VSPRLSLPKASFLTSSRITTRPTATLPAPYPRRTGDLAPNQYEVWEERGRPAQQFSASPPPPLPTRVNALVDDPGVVPGASPAEAPCAAGRLRSGVE